MPLRLALIVIVLATTGVSLNSVIVVLRYVEKFVFLLEFGLQMFEVLLEI